LKNLYDDYPLSSTEESYMLTALAYARSFSTLDSSEIMANIDLFYTLTGDEKRSRDKEYSDLMKINEYMIKHPDIQYIPYMTMMSYKYLSLKCTGNKVDNTNIYNKMTNAIISKLITK